MKKHDFCRYSQTTPISIRVAFVCTKIAIIIMMIVITLIIIIICFFVITNRISSISILIIMVLYIITITIIIIIVIIGMMAGARFSLVFLVVSDIPHLAHTQTRTHAHT